MSKTTHTYPLTTAEVRAAIDHHYDHPGAFAVHFAPSVPPSAPRCARAPNVAVTDESTPSGGEPMDHSYGPDDIAESSLASIRLDCAQFVREQAAVLDYCDETGDLPTRGREFSDAYVQAGHDFWLTRNGHGAGFWDGDWEITLPERADIEGAPNAGDVLTDAAHKFGACDLYVGDDGKVYVTPERAS